MIERIALDTRYWHAQQQAIENTASLLIEQKEGALQERINYTEIFLDPDGDLYHPAFGKIKDIIEVKTEIDQLELNAVSRLSEWAKNHQSGQAIWISPSYPGQDESRFIIYELEEVDGRKKISLHAICGKQNLSECLFIAQQTQAFSNEEIPPIENEESLRKTPIPFDPQPTYPTWIDFLGNLINPPEIWEEIRSRNHIRRKQELQAQVGKVMARIYPEIAQARTSYQHLTLGAQLEQELIRRGHGIMHIGPCGITNTFALQNLWAAGINTNSAFSLMSEAIPLLEKSFPCPKCHGPIPSGRGITKCPHCGITKEEYGSYCD